MKKNWLILLLLLQIRAFSQREIPRDTSFTIRATLEKERKKRPYISVAEPELPAGVKLEKDLGFKLVNGHRLLLDIFYPESVKELKPAVLLIFGGGWRSGDKSQNHAMAAELSRHGYVAVSAEYRLSLEATYPAAVTDLRDALRWMRSHAARYGLDPGRIAVLGCSAGGQLAALLGTAGKVDSLGGMPADTTGASVQAVIDIDGTLAFHHPESAEGAVAAQWLGGTYAENPGNWEDAAPLNHTDKNTPPILFINSSLPRFHAGRDDMIRKLDSLQIYSEVHTIPDTPHPFWFFHPWFNQVIQFSTRFLDKVFP